MCGGERADVVRLVQMPGKPEALPQWLLSGFLTWLGVLLSAEFVLAVIADILGRIASLVDRLLSERVSNTSSVRLMRHAATLDLEDFEDSEFQDQLERARRQTSGRMTLMGQLFGQANFEGKVFMGRSRRDGTNASTLGRRLGWMGDRDRADSPYPIACYRAEEARGRNSNPKLRYSLLEGIVSKHRDRPHRAGRSLHWSKLNNPARAGRGLVNGSLFKILWVTIIGI